MDIPHSFNPFETFHPDDFETFSMKSAFHMFDTKMGTSTQHPYPRNMKGNVLASARRAHSQIERDDFFPIHHERLTHVRKQTIYDRLNHLQYELCHCMYTERSAFRKDLFDLATDVLTHTGADVILKQRAQDAANVCIDTANQDLDIQFLHLCIVGIIGIQKHFTRYKHSLRAACDYQAKVHRTLRENFLKRTSYEYLLGCKSNGSRLEDDVMFLVNECKKSLTDAMFKIRFQSVLDLHFRNQNQQKKRPPQTQASRAAAKQLAFQYQDRSLSCFPEVFVDPPQTPKKLPWAGFWMHTKNVYNS